MANLDAPFSFVVFLGMLITHYGKCPCVGELSPVTLSAIFAISKRVLFLTCGNNSIEIVYLFLVLFHYLNQDSVTHGYLCYFCYYAISTLMKSRNSAIIFYAISAIMLFLL